ncbi:MAG TPA: xanthine dehydrogenase family protein subunit M [Gaiellaceae bacterium]|jgi:Aerobic-type carbon monoxide dehydrogenase, middle subunit CoxM/CutM homologs|nr:xanthine dehydrogenase family protein subunit M [Gaiellaceae bacterium]
MIPAAFDYEVADSVGHALSLVTGREDAKLLAGGHSLLPVLRLRFARPSLLVDIGRLEELSYIRDAGDTIAIGALTRHHDVVTSPIVREHNPLVSYAASLIGDPQVRHRGTIGGSLAHGDPASDLPAVLLALDGEVDIAGADGVRTVAADDFFRGVFDTAVGLGEMVTEVRVPKLGADHVWSYLKFRRRAQDWATVGVAAVARRSNGGVTDAAIGLVNMGATPLRAKSSEAAWAAGADAGAAADEGTEPPTDTNGSAEFRRHLARVLVRRAVEEAIHR